MRKHFFDSILVRNKRLASISRVILGVGQHAKSRLNIVQFPSSKLNDGRHSIHGV
jgi:hypothetical protein